MITSAIASVVYLNVLGRTGTWISTELPNVARINATGTPTVTFLSHNVESVRSFTICVHWIRIIGAYSCVLTPI